MSTSEILMTDPTTEAGRKYWEDRRRLEEWQAAQTDEPIYELLQVEYPSEELDE